MLGIAAALIALGTISKSWFGASAHGAGFHLGPIGAEVCGVSGCSPTSVSGDKLGGDVEIMMLLAVLGGFVSAAGCGWFAFGGFTGKKDKLPPVKLLQIALGIAAFSMAYFAIRVLTKSELKELGPSWGMFVGIGGVILGWVGVMRLRPFLPATSALAPMPWLQQQAGQPPMQQQPYGQQPQQPYGQAPVQPYGQPMQQQPPMQQPAQAAAPNCPRCGQPLQFVAQYQRWFCAREQQYV